MNSLRSIEQKIQEAINIRYSNTIQSLNYGIEIFDWAKLNNADKEKAYANTIIGFAKNIQHHPEVSLKNLFSAYDYFVHNKKEIGYLITVNSLANFYDLLGDYNNAMLFVNEGLNEATDNKNQEYLADLYSTQGTVYSRIADYSKALEAHSKALYIREQIENYPAQASSLNLIARTNALAADYEQAEQYYNKSIELREKHNDKGGLLWSFIGMASMYVEMCDMQKALRYYNKAQELNKSINDLRGSFLIQKGIARSYLHIKEYDKVKGLLQHLVELAEKQKSKPLLYQAYKVLSEYYDGIKEFETALDYYKRYTETRNEVVNEGTLNKLNQQQASFEIEQSKKDAEIHRLKHVELKHAYDEIKASINYAERIQKSLLPKESKLDDLLSEHFIIYKPKDIVSGDFYWFKKEGNRLIITAADCTGHGVPGAFMSMLGMSFLYDIVTKHPELSSDLILEKLREKVKEALKQSKPDSNSKDGMDIALCIINLETKQLQFSGAYNPLYIIRNNELIQLKANRQPIAVHEKEEPFIAHYYKLEKDDCLYMFSDGYADQFGGPNNRKFMSKNLKNMLLEISHSSLKEQKKYLNDNFEHWKGNNEQMDDVLIVGIKI